MNDKFKEKRRSNRIALRVPIRYQVRGTNEFSNAVCENVSTNGLCFTERKFIPPQRLIMLEVSILSCVLKPIARIVWTRHLPHSDRIRIGVEFVEMDATDKSFLVDYINMRAN